MHTKGSQKGHSMWYQIGMLLKVLSTFWNKLKWCQEETFYTKFRPLKLDLFMNYNLLIIFIFLRLNRTTASLKMQKLFTLSSSYFATCLRTSLKIFLMKFPCSSAVWYVWGHCNVTENLKSWPTIRGKL